MNNSTKYPRTFHLPYSQGLSGDDKIAPDGWQDNIIGVPIVITEKLDGENSAITKYGAFSRSHAAPTTHAWASYIWNNGGLYDQIKPFLDDDVIIYGENMYGIHSIEYDKLPCYFHMFAHREGDVFSDIDYTCDISSILGLSMVPMLFKGVVYSEKELENMVMGFMNGKSAYGDTIEGVVVRNAGSFLVDDFSKNVVKYVRKGHVQTNEHWTKNWRKAKLEDENY